MIEIDSTIEAEAATIRLSGTVTEPEFAELAAEIAHLEVDGLVLAFLDWLGVDDWEFSTPERSEVSAWRSAAEGMRRVSIVHGRRLNRQAAGWPRSCAKRVLPFVAGGHSRRLLPRVG